MAIEFTLSPLDMTQVKAVWTEDAELTPLPSGTLGYCCDQGKGIRLTFPLLDLTQAKVVQREDSQTEEPDPGHQGRNPGSSG